MKFFLFLLIITFYSCTETSKLEINKKKYTVRLSNMIGSVYYECDTVIFITDTHISIQNHNQIEPLVEIMNIPKDVIIQIYNNNEIKKNE